MEKSSKPLKRRRHERYKVEGGTVCVTMPLFIKMGQINDIGKGGLSFLYFDSGGSHDEIPHSFELSISMEENNLHIERLPFITIADFKVKPDFVEMRQRCVRFGDMNPTQKLHLDYFIQNLAGN